jgi:hypothetical protein
MILKLKVLNLIIRKYFLKFCKKKKKKILFKYYFFFSVKLYLRIGKKIYIFFKEIFFSFIIFFNFLLRKFMKKIYSKQ